MAEKVEISIALRKSEREELLRLCEDYGCTLDMLVEEFLRWCVEDPERAKEWLLEENGMTMPI